MAGKQKPAKPEAKGKSGAKDKNEVKGKQVSKAAPAAPVVAAAPAAPAPASAAPAPAQPVEKKAKPVPPRHGIPLPAHGSKFFGAPKQGKRPGPRVPPAHPVHMPTGNRRGG